MPQRATLTWAIVQDSISRILLGLPAPRRSPGGDYLTDVHDEPGVQLYANLRDMRPHILPGHWEPNCLRVDAPSEIEEDARRGLLVPPDSSSLFGHDFGLADLLGEVCMQLLGVDTVPVRIIRHDSSPKGFADSGDSPVKRLAILRPHGVEPLGIAGYVIHPSAYWPAQRQFLHNRKHGEWVPWNDIVLFRRPQSLGPVPPLLAALPAILESRRMLPSITMQMAARYSRPRGPRHQFLRMRSIDFQTRSMMIDVRQTVALGASVLDQLLYHPGLTQHFTQYFLAWQHRDALRRAAELRDAVLLTTNRYLMPNFQRQWSASASRIQVRVVGGPTRETIDASFAEFECGALSLQDFHLRSSRWM